MVCKADHHPLSLPAFTLLLIGVVMILSLGSCTDGCPSDCICKWKGGKQFVECVSRNFRTFPPKIDPGTQVLDMSGNSFETLPPDHFMRNGLINLQKIFLSKCRLSHINSRAFRGLSNLVELDLTGNLLRDVPTSAFPDMTGLMRLVLSGNPIAILGKRAFLMLESLTSLELSSAGLELIEQGAFEGLQSLEWLKLDGNRLKSIKGLSILPLSLKGFSLEDNPWECDCHLLELRLWLSDRNVASSAEPRCNGPDRLENVTIKSLPQEALACLPQLSPTTMFQKIGEGKNVSLLCKVVSVPESSLEWLFNGSPLTNSSLNLLVETTSAYPSGYSSPLTSSSIAATTPVEKKSELLILNATLEENGTFLCLAKNPAGSASANFTLRVLTKYDPSDPSGSGGGGDYSYLSGLGQLPQLVSNYPNLFIIGLSTVAVIGLVLILSTLSFVLCKCTNFLWGKSSSSARRRGGERSSSSKNMKHSESGESGGNDVLGKLDRGGILSLSDASTLTTSATTKSSNGGSVFLLSSADSNSNPDLIEGAVAGSKRGDGDGLDSTIYNQQHQYHHPHYPSEGGIYYTTQINNPPSNNSPSATIVPNSNPSSLLHTTSRGNTTTNFGTLPRSLQNPRSSPSWPIMEFNGLPPPPGPVSYVGLPSSSYDLSKYPKEYISPGASFPSNNYDPQEYTVYTTTLEGTDPYQIYHHPPHQQMYLPHVHHHPHSNNTVPQEYVVNPVTCSCGPILEGNETEDANDPVETTCPPTTTVAPPKTKTASTSTPLRTSSERLNCNGLSSSSSTSSSSKRNGPVVTTSSRNNKNEVAGQTLTSSLQQQNHGQINESPDEGYEDGGAEGTEI
ncbi:uncharacterized protein LOC110853596 [Folsomia candida]|uniref:uncharacterized protein LOC110853596 n=1 Tax=Folsomia candida TaxID=158441 RepID=UPI0016054DC3|nr:uncharacterized protein LOC110853596 [Folsomia candida]